MIRQRHFRCRKTMTAKGALLALAFSGCAMTSLAPPASAAVTSYATGGVTVHHNTGDEGMYYNTPSNQVGYNTQVLRLPSGAPANYVTIYHSEPRNKPIGYPGDSIKVGTFNGTFNYLMPTNKAFRLWGVQDDSLNILYSPSVNNGTGWGGTGNPMMVKGKPGDSYYYAFFLAVRDDNADRIGSDFRHYLCQARTLNFTSWQIRSEIGGVVQWTPFSDSATIYQRRARTIQDVNGATINSQKAVAVDQTQGLIGSICYVGGLYYYFYTDVALDGATYLYYRTSSDISLLTPTWSAATKATNEQLQPGCVVRVAKAHGMDRWALLYNGYRYAGANLKQDLMLQYTPDLGVSGIGALTFYNSYVSGQGISDKFLGLGTGTGYAQHYFLTNEYGNLEVPAQETSSYTRGGMITWTDPYPSIFGGKIYRAGWDVS